MRQASASRGVYQRAQEFRRNGRSALECCGLARRGRLRHRRGTRSYPRVMKKNVRASAGPVIGFLAGGVWGWLLFHELGGLSLEAVWASLPSIPPHRYLLAAASTLVAYAALAG